MKNFCLSFDLHFTCIDNHDRHAGTNGMLKGMLKGGHLLLERFTQLSKCHARPYPKHIPYLSKIPYGGIF